MNTFNPLTIFSYVVFLSVFLLLFLSILSTLQTKPCFKAQWKQTQAQLDWKPLKINDLNIQVVIC